MLKGRNRQNSAAQNSNANSLKLQLGNKCEVDIFGHRYTLRSDSDDDYARQLAAFVDKKMNELSENAKGVDLSKLAIFAAVNIAHELFLLRKQSKESETMISRKTRSLIDSIEEQFEEFRPR
jgi:cell division protein ZapA (FtsZ GTPase activity inhibitor)